MSSLSVIVPATNDPPHLGRCLEAIRSADGAPEEIIVVREPPELGPAAARNVGAERFTAPFVEDVDLGMRLVDAGHEIRLDHELLGTHLKRWTLRDMVHTDLTRRGAPWIALLLRRGRSSSALNLAWRQRMSTAG